MISKTNLCNMALGHLGNGQRITNIEEDSAEAKTCRLFYDVARDATLSDYRWPFSRKFKTLGLVEEDPTSEWAFSYRYPNDALYIRRIFSGIRNDTEDSIVPYLVGQDDAGLILYCDLNECEIEYTAKCENTGTYPTDFAIAISYRLASLIAPQISKGNGGTKQSEEMFKLYLLHAGQAVANRLSEDRPDRNLVDSFTRSRS